jgi:hypothetical protein
MRFARIGVVAFSVAAGACSQLFGLEAPTHKPDADECETCTDVPPLPGNEAGNDVRIDAPEAISCTGVERQRCGSERDDAYEERECITSTEFGACAADGWRAMAAPPSSFGGRVYGAALAVGAEAFFWGGQSNDALHDDGAIYNPRRNEWRLLPPAPLRARREMAAVWTGTKVFLWGGKGDTAPHTDALTFKDGALYDPQMNRWTYLPESPVLSARKAPAAVWAPSTRRVLLWGGTESFCCGDGASFDPETRAWEKLPDSPLEARSAPAAFWDGTAMVVPMGHGCTDGFDIDAPCTDAARFDPASRAWLAFPLEPGLRNRKDVVIAETPPCSACSTGHSPTKHATTRAPTS